MFKLIKEHKGMSLVISGLIFNVVESIYFGWGTTRGFNLHAGSVTEMICDYIALAMIFIGGYMAATKVQKIVNVNVENMIDAKDFAHQLNEALKNVKVTQ